MGAQKHFDGKKLAGRHTTVSEASSEVIRRLSKFPIRINAGYITSGVRASNRRIIVRGNGAGGSLLLSVIGNGASQDIRVFTDEPEAVRSEIESWDDFKIIYRPK